MRIQQAIVFNKQLYSTSNCIQQAIVFNKQLYSTSNCIQQASVLNKQVYSTGKGYSTGKCIQQASVFKCGDQFWSPHLRRDIDKMERVQRKATKIIPEIRNHSYQHGSRI